MLNVESDPISSKKICWKAVQFAFAENIFKNWREKKHFINFLIIQHNINLHLGLSSWFESDPAPQTERL